MDELDFGILTQLQADGRRPFTEIAKELSVAEGTIRNRVAKMMADDTLQIIGHVDPHRVGFGAPALVSISVQPGKVEEVASAVQTFPELSYLLLVAGEYDLLLEVMCRDREHLRELITTRLHGLEGVTNTHTTLILHTYKVVQPDLNLVKTTLKSKR
ncbi:MAG: Lrp/AsnC family transcriptional regulator [Chloroflexi bacterium]|nr:Lrp/AsnC family transcriptional regulator [Chloroflexota bacterium]